MRSSEMNEKEYLAYHKSNWLIYIRIHCNNLADLIW